LPERRQKCDFPYDNALLPFRNSGRFPRGIRVVDAKTGAPCTVWQSVGRNVFTIFGPLDWIFSFGERCQRLGDKLDGTIVLIAD